MSQQQAQIDAMEHLVVALIKELKIRNGLHLAAVIGAAKTSVFDSNGSGDHQQKNETAQYIEHLAFRLGASTI